MEQIAVSSSAAVVDPDATLGSSAPSTTEDDEQEEYQGNGDVDDASDSNLVAEEANDSISAAGETPKPKRRRFTKGVIEENQGIFPVEYLREYRWPADRHGEFFILQEQVSEYLDILSFKRKYPGK